MFGGYMELTKDILNKYFEYDKETGNLIRKVAISQSKIGDVAGYIKKSDGYVYIKFFGKTFLAHRLVWILHFGTNPSCDIDHINCIRNDNRIENLRIASRSKNLHNSSARARNTTGHKGITYVKKGKKKWQANVTIDYKYHYIGVFNSIEEAINARDDYCKKIIGNSYRTS